MDMCPMMRAQDVSYIARASAECRSVGERSLIGPERLCSALMKQIACRVSIPASETQIVDLVLRAATCVHRSEHAQT